MNKYVKFIISIIVVILLSVVIDVLCIFTINRPIFAIKYVVSDSTGDVYKGLFFDTYNCAEYTVPQIKSKGSKFHCSYIDFVVNNNSGYVKTELDKVSISIFDISLSGATIMIRDTNFEPYTYGEWYKLEKLVDGNWEDVPTIRNDHTFNEIGYLPNRNNEVTFKINWEDLYGKLSLGYYRILKYASDKIIYVEFGIVTTSNKKIDVIKSKHAYLNEFNKYL